MRKMTVIAILLIGLASGGCSDSETHWGDNDGNGQNQDQNQDNGSNSSISIDPLFDKVEFETTEVGEETTETAGLREGIDDVVVIDEVSLEGEPFSVDPPVSEWPDEIAPEENFEVEFTYAPETAEEHVGALTIEWTEQDGDQYERATGLIGNEACIEAAPETLDFSGVDIGATATKSTTVANCGVPTLGIAAEISASRPGGGTNAQSFPEEEPFSIVDQDQLPEALAAEETVEVSVEYAPEQEPEWYYDLEIPTDAQYGLTQDVTLDHGYDLGDPCDGGGDGNDVNQC